MFFKRKKAGTVPPGDSDRGPGAKNRPEAGSAVADPGSGESDEIPVDSGKGGARATFGAASGQFLTGDTATDKRTVQVLLEAIARVSESRDVDQLLEDIVDRSIEVTKAERGFLLIRGSGGEKLAVRVARSQGGKALEGDRRFSTSIANKVLEERQAVRATAKSDTEALGIGQSVHDLKLRAALCVPLVSLPSEGQGAAERNERAAGVLYVDSRAAARSFTRRDLAVFAALAQFVSIALENARLHLDSLEKLRLEQSLELASVIQHDLMPDAPTDVSGWDIHGWYRPAERTAGDFYDFVKTDDGRLAFAVGDVTGHGVGPALITAAAGASMRAYLSMLKDPGPVVTRLNQELCERIGDGRFLTLYLGMLAQDGTVEHINAGQAEPLLWRKQTRELENFPKDGPALGMLEGEVYEAGALLSMSPGDVLCVFTDGLTEARSVSEPDVFFGEEGMRRVLSEAASGGLDARAITTQLVEAALSVAQGNREDDMTLVVVRRV